MQEQLRKGADLFNQRAYWEAHEAWEEAWLTATGPDRHYLSALILLAAAMHKRWVHGNLKNRNFDKALRHLALLPETYRGTDLLGLRERVWNALSDPEVTPQICLD